MLLELDQIANATFRTPAAGEEIAQRIKDTLGFGAFNLPARLAIARSLAIPEPPPAIGGDGGRGINGNNLFGSGPDLAAWLSLLIEHDLTPVENLADLHARVRAHWLRGLIALDQSLAKTDGDREAFWIDIAQSALSDGIGAVLVDAGDIVPRGGAIAIPVGPVGTDLSSGDTVFWRPNVGGGSPHAAFMGGIGSGKTRTAIFMLRTLRQSVSVPLIAFDFKGDMTDEDNALDRSFDAQVIAPPYQPLPLDVLALVDRSPNGITAAALRVRDSLATLKGAGFGPRQKDALAEAAEQALRTCTPCRLTDLRDALKAIYADRGWKEDGAIMTLNDLCRLPLFTPDLDPQTFFKRSWIIRLGQDLPDTVRVAIVTLVTDALDRYLNPLPDSPTDAEGNRALRVVCLIDEAHRVLGARLPGLSNLIRMSRSKGGAVMLISQKPDDFAGVDDEFLGEMGIIACLATNASPQAVRKILGPNANLSVLQRGQAWVKLRGEASARRIMCWQPAAAVDTSHETVSGFVVEIRTS